MVLTRWLVGIILLSATPCWAAIVEVGGGSQRAIGQGFHVDSTAAAFPANVTANNLSIVCGALFSPSGNIGVPGVTDTRGTTYSVAMYTDAAYDRTAFVAYGIFPSSGANTVTVNGPSASETIGFAITEFSGVDTTAPLNVQAGGASGTGSSPTITITPAANTLIVGCGNFNGPITITPGANYTQIGENENDASNIAFSAIYRIISSTGTYNINWTIGAAQLYWIFGASFKPAPVTPGAGRIPLLLHGR